MYRDPKKLNEYSKNWMAKKRAIQSPEEKLAHSIYMKQWNRDNYEKVRNNRLKKKFGITLEQYNECFKAQKGCCAICGTHQSELKKALSVDHCHVTKRNRSLLCDRCNVAIGLFGDNPKLLEMAAAYLHFHKARADS